VRQQLQLYHTIWLDYTHILIQGIQAQKGNWSIDQSVSDSAMIGGVMSPFSLWVLGFFWLTCYVTNQNNWNSLAGRKLVPWWALNWTALQLCTFCANCPICFLNKWDACYAFICDLSSVVISGSKFWIETVKATLFVWVQLNMQLHAGVTWLLRALSWCVSQT